MSADKGKARKKIASMAMKNPRIRKSFEDAWYYHARMFGELIEPAFADDEAARFDLVAALNFLSRREEGRALIKLKELFDFCRSDADFAAWYYFTGLCYERMGLRSQAISMYFESAKREPRHYMVYLCLAKRLHEERQYELAVSCYMHTLELVSEPKPSEVLPMIKKEQLLGSVHGNLATCLLMMRRYDEAEYELYESESCGFDNPLMHLNRAMLYAATDRKQGARQEMAKLREKLPEAEVRSVLSIEAILAGKNPHFCVQRIDTKRLEDFWTWFSENEERLYKELSEIAASGAKQGPSVLGMKLFDCFGQNDETVRFVVGRDKNKLSLGFLDGYSVSYEIWLERLVDTAPQNLKERWSFYAAH